MQIDNINTYLKEFVSNVNRQKKSNIEVKVDASLVTKSGDNTIYISFDDGLETLDITIFVPYDRKVSANVKIDYSENEKVIASHIGNSRDVPLGHDLNLISMVIKAGFKEQSPIEYIIHKLTEVFGKKKKTKEKKIDVGKSKKKDFTLNIEKLDDMVKKANIKGAGITKWSTTPNKKIVVKYVDKNDEYYGSEAETSTHLYFAYMLKNENRSTKVF